MIGLGGHIVRGSWIEECFNRKKKIPRADYSLKPDYESESEDSAEEEEGKRTINMKTIFRQQG